LKKYEILAKFDDFASGQEVGCGFIEAETTLNAITILLTEKFDDLAFANEVTAYNSDDEFTATAYFDGDGCEIHLYNSNGTDIMTINRKTGR
jgi:hypothetical protein